MKAQDIRKLNAAQIEKKIADLKEELFNLKFQAALGNLERPARMNEIKRDIARLKTILTEGSYSKEAAPKKTRAKKADAPKEETPVEATAEAVAEEAPKKRTRTAKKTEASKDAE